MAHPNEVMNGVYAPMTRMRNGDCQSREGVGGSWGAEGVIREAESFERAKELDRSKFLINPIDKTKRASYNQMRNTVHI